MDSDFAIDRSPCHGGDPDYTNSIFVQDILKEEERQLPQEMEVDK